MTTRRKDRPHYSYEEKRELLEEHGIHTTSAGRIANAIDDLTYIGLDQLAKALVIIRQGKKN